MDKKGFNKERYAQMVAAGQVNLSRPDGEMPVIPKPAPQMTDRDRLAEKLFIHAITHENVEGDNRVHKAIYAVEAANILFNQLEANTDE